MGHDGIYSAPKQSVVFSEYVPTMNEDDIAWGEVGLAADAVLQARRERDYKKIHKAVDRLNEAYMLLLRCSHFAVEATRTPAEVDVLVDMIRKA